MSSSSSFYSANILSTQGTKPQIKVFICVTGFSSYTIHNGSEETEIVENIRQVFANKKNAEEWQRWMSGFINLMSRYRYNTLSYVESEHRKQRDTLRDRDFLNKFCRWLNLDYDEYDDPDIEVVLESLTLYRDSPVKVDFYDEWAEVKEFEVN